MPVAPTLAVHSPPSTVHPYNVHEQEQQALYPRTHVDRALSTIDSTGRPRAGRTLTEPPRTSVPKLKAVTYLESPTGLTGRTTECTPGWIQRAEVACVLSAECTRLSSPLPGRSQRTRTILGCRVTASGRTSWAVARTPVSDGLRRRWDAGTGES